MRVRKAYTVVVVFALFAVTFLFLYMGGRHYSIVTLWDVEGADGKTITKSFVSATHNGMYAKLYVLFF